MCFILANPLICVMEGIWKWTVFFNQVTSEEDFREEF